MNRVRIAGSFRAVHSTEALWRAESCGRLGGVNIDIAMVDLWVGCQSGGRREAHITSQTGGGGGGGCECNLLT